MKLGQTVNHQDASLCSTQSCFAHQRLFSKWLMAPEPQTLDKKRPTKPQFKQSNSNPTKPGQIFFSKCIIVHSKWLMAPEPQTLDKERKHLDLLRPPYHEAWRSTRAALEQTWQRSATDTHSTKEPKTFRNRQILQNLKNDWLDFWFSIWC